MSDKLTEALASIEPQWLINDDMEALVMEAAHRWASFPTDEDVEVAQKAMLRFGPMASIEGMRAALEALK